MFKSHKIKTVYTAFLYFVLATLSGISCSKDQAFDLFVDNSLQDYFDRFVVEGAKRNVTVDYEAARVSGYIKEINTPNVIGQCAHDPKKPNTVIVDRTYWNNGTDLEKEFLVFHELGHCVLNREHLDEADARGNCISIMTSGSAQCRINYTMETRDKLLDELFKK
ncbi:MAG: hypothetical protein IPP15_10675 [Saprospiraceae bacterium]|uniref:Uncharacterized protein n=1 Tax=Candidatus Opimibacter skivensis TaxID=2982028 RepID=A0A9D7SWA4_9BACT|nr:hypothetical protein [Candidatus Opimibacter skivensis]